MPEKPNRFLGLSTILSKRPTKPTAPENPHLKASQEWNEQNTTGHKALLKNLTFQDPPIRQKEFRAFANQPSSVSEHQLAPEKTHLSHVFSPHSLPNSLTLCTHHTMNMADLVALRQNPAKAHL